MQPTSKLLWSAYIMLAACSTTSGLGIASKEDDDLAFAQTAEGNMRLGDEATRAERYVEAARYYTEVKTKYPFLAAAKVAELKLGDVDFMRERFIEARDRYKNFIRLHPTHPKVDYAAFRAALTHYRDMPSNFFLLPPASEKDQQEIRSARVKLVHFLETYPNSSHVAEAKRALSIVQKRLVEHELYVAKFYKRRDRWPAVVSRLTAAAKNYSDAGYDTEIYFGLYEAFKQLNDDARAQEALRAYLQLHPSDGDAHRARKLLKTDS